MTVTQGTDRAVIDWRSFSIGAGETTRFVQPSASSVTANRVTGGDPSSVLGSLKANGTVVLVNRNGIVFGTDARVDAGGLVATVHDLDTAGFMSGSDVLRFEGGARPGASVVNHGTISVRDAGLAAFVAPHVRNEGVITADFGRVALASAKGFSVDLYGDGLLSFAPGDGLEETIGDGAEALVQNGGTLAGSRVLLTAHAAREVVNASVNVSGLVRATSVSSRGGVITLGGSGSVRVSGRGRLDASGSGGRRPCDDQGGAVLDGRDDRCARCGCEWSCGCAGRHSGDHGGRRDAWRRDHCVRRVRRRRGCRVAGRAVSCGARRGSGAPGFGGQHPLSRAAGRGDGDGVDERIGSDPWGDDQRYGGPVDRHVGFLCGGRRLRQGGTHRHERAGRAPSVRGS
ncbi:two-partner secretion domain-containing protein [Sinorhizobium medicae]